MTDEVTDMIGKALRDEPPVGVDYDSVLAAGRRRRARRQLGIVGGAALGVAVAVSSAVLVGHISASPSSVTPAGPTTSSTPPPAGCAMPPRTGGFSDDPSGAASAEELAESGRLTAAFARFAFPLPPGVSMDPAHPQLCAIRYSWGTQFTLHSPAGDRSVFLEVRPRSAQQPGPCRAPEGKRTCHTSVLPDDTAIMITEEPDPGTGGAPVIASVIAWRADDTLVRVMETGAQSATPTPRILDVSALIKIADAPEFKVTWSGPVRPPDASERRAAELTVSIAALGALPNGVRAEKVPQARADALAFYVSQGGYKLNADLVDATGSGNLFINLSMPDPGASVGCHGEPGCEQLTLSDGRPATVSHQTDGSVQRILLSTLASDHTQVSIMTSNQSEKAQSRGKTGPTRPTPLLSGDDLVKLAALPWLRW